MIKCISVSLEPLFFQLVVPKGARSTGFSLNFFIKAVFPQSKVRLLPSIDYPFIPLLVLSLIFFRASGIGSFRVSGFIYLPLNSFFYSTTSRETTIPIERTWQIYWNHTHMGQCNDRYPHKYAYHVWSFIDIISDFPGKSKIGYLADFIFTNKNIASSKITMNTLKYKTFHC